MTFNLGEVIVWLIIGALAGSLAARLFTGRRRGLGWLGNIIIGLIGAVIGGFLFQALGISLGLGAITLSFDALVAAFIGAVLLLVILSALRR